MEFALARFSAMIRMRPCWALSAEAAIAWATPDTGLISGTYALPYFPGGLAARRRMLSDFW